jgi:DNA processing protein
LAAVGEDAHAAGGTIAIVGTGADLDYPSGHRELGRAMRRSGLLLSEFPLGSPAIAHHFPRRNRVIAALARGVLVVEAALHSGSLITARLANELGREVFAIPGSIHSPLARGCHRLIRDGAKLVESARDVLEELRLEPAVAAARGDRSGGGRSEDGATDSADTLGAAAATGALLEALGHDPVGLDVLAERCGQATGPLTAALLELELAGRIERLPGNCYRRLGA